MCILIKNDIFEREEAEKKQNNDFDPSVSQKINQAGQTLDKRMPKKDWKPSTDRIVNGDPIKNYISKLEYKNVLDQQVLEKQLSRAHEEKVREMQLKIEELRLSKEKLKRELEDKTVVSNFPRAKKDQKQQQQPHLHIPSSVINSVDTTNEDIYSQPKRIHRTSKSNGIGLGGGGGVIILQPGDPNTKKNKPSIYNYSSRKSSDNKLSSRRDLHESASRSEMEVFGSQNQVILRREKL